MDVADVLQLIGAFLGGGVVTKVLDHVFADWHDRRSALRAKDHERIAQVRAAVADSWAIARQDFTRAWPHPPFLLPMERIDATGRAVAELNDRRATKRWWTYIKGAITLPIMRTCGDDDQSHEAGVLGAPKWEAMARRRYERLIRRLNRLERRR